MPRTAKRTQPPRAPQDQGYGVRGEQIAAQHEMPLPDNHSMEVVPAEAPMPASQAAQPVTDPAQLLQMMQNQAPPPAGGLTRPSERPEEPITAGLGVPLDATQATPARNRAAEALEQIFAVTGDLRFQEMAQRARSI